MNTTFIISGGAGRVIAAVPALEKYARLNPKDDFKVLVYGWESLFWSHPILQNRTFSIHQKGTFENSIKNYRVICPEPYYVHDYYNQRISLAQAFDCEINKTSDHSDLGAPKLYISTLERNSALRILRETNKGEAKTLVIQPYGSGMGIVNNRPFDPSHRSLDVDDYLKIVKRLREKNKDLMIVYFGDQNFRHPADDISADIKQYNPDLRAYLSLIAVSDYFVGCDSVGQHMARALDKSGMVIMGATDETNVTYPDHFTIYRKKDQTPTYSPIRLSGLDCEFADRMNDGIMKFDDGQIEEICDIINLQLYS
jgi:hypothetical protein